LRGSFLSSPARRAARPLLMTRHPEPHRRRRVSSTKIDVRRRDPSLSAQLRMTKVISTFIGAPCRSPARDDNGLGDDRSESLVSSLGAVGTVGVRTRAASDEAEQLPVAAVHEVHVARHDLANFGSLAEL